MLKKGVTHSFISKCITICSTFLVVGIVLFNTSISAFAIQNWQRYNDTVYASASGYAHEELPYGLDTAVVQIRYASSKYLTLYFDKLTIFNRSNNVNIQNAEYSNLTDYYYSIRRGLGNNLTINIVSDSPIYYRTSYHSDGVFQSTIGELKTKSLYFTQHTSAGEYVVTEEAYSVYEFSGTLYNIVGENFVSGYTSVYSNVFMVEHSTLSYDSFGNEVTGLFYHPVPALGQNMPGTVGTLVGYSIAYYPTIQYLQDESIRAELVTTWQKLNTIIDLNNSMLTELYTVNAYLVDLITYAQSIDNWLETTQSYLEAWLPLMDYHLSEIIELLEGPEYDSSQGIGSNTEFGDAFGGLISNDSPPSLDSEKTLIQRDLGGSLMFIRLMFESITARLGFTYLITFLLGLSFIAYVLGRVIKNKMKS